MTSVRKCPILENMNITTPTQPESTAPYVVDPSFPWLLRVPALVVTEKTKDWCKAPYPKHPKGCPNACGRCWGKDGTKPMRLLTDVIAPDSPVYVVYNEYAVDARERELAALHPEWTRKQCRCLLYWQGTARKELDRKIEMAKRLLAVRGFRPDFVTDGEHNGVNVYATMRKCGLKLDVIRRLSVARHLRFLCSVRPGTVGLPGYQGNGRLHEKA